MTVPHNFEIQAEMDIAGSHLHGIHPDTIAICRQVRINFGLEKGMAPPTKATLAVVNKSIERLAAELYAKEVHFLLEVRSL